MNEIMKMKNKVRISRALITPLHKGRPKSQGINLGKKNGLWRGEKVGYAGIHDYIKYHLPKSRLCQICNMVPPYDLANRSGEYKRDLNDWYWLCRSCHMKSDHRLFNRDKRGRFKKKEEVIEIADKLGIDSVYRVFDLKLSFQVLLLVMMLTFF